jgi:hypothetical protein
MSKHNAEIIAKLDSRADSVSRGFSGIELRLARIEAALIQNKIVAIA